MIEKYTQERFTRVYHKKYGTALVAGKEDNPNFLTAAVDIYFTCYRLGNNDLIYLSKAYSFPKHELTLKPVVPVSNQIRTLG